MEDNKTPLYSNEVIYRPVGERDSAFLEVASGCSWAKCAFCDFIHDEYYLFPLNEVEEKAKIINGAYSDRSRLFLLGQNSFSLSMSYLEQVFEIVRRHLPNIREVSMYARADDITGKTMADLGLLRAMGLRELHVGVESGSDRVLESVNKGVTVSDMEAAFHALDEVGIDYSVTSVLGLGGKGLSNEHALATAALYNKIAPVSIWCLALKVWPGTPLARLVEAGGFVPCTYREMLIEEKTMLLNMEKASGYFMDTTCLGKYTIRAMLPDGRQNLIDSIDWLLKNEALDI